MNSKNRLKPKIIASTICLLLLGVWVFFSNEARKEVYFLCGNFKAGNSYANVVRQLDTISLSEYKIENTGTRKRITHSSKLNLHMVKCNIEFNPQEEVVSVLYG